MCCAGATAPFTVSYSSLRSLFFVGMSFLLSFVLLIIDARIHGGVLNGTGMLVHNSISALEPIISPFYLIFLFSTGEQKLEAQKYLNSTDVATIVTETSPLINPSS